MSQANGSIPKACDIVVIGGGPAGSSVATLLARQGLEVVLLEKAKHPRPNVGESIIPHFWKFADLLGVSDKMRQEGFLAKAGGIIVWDDKIHQVKFSSFGYTDRVGLHVERDILDHLLLRHAAEHGAQVYEEVLVAGASFSDPEAPTVTYDDRRGDSTRQGRITCKYVVDASGSSSVLAGQFNSRKRFGSEGKYLGLWGYYANADYLGVDRQRHKPEEAQQVKPVTFVLSYEDGWVWHIILRESTSVGLVMNTSKVKGMGKKAQEQYLRETCARIPYLRELLEPATFIEGSMFFRPDYSYYSEKIWGEGFFCIGDAAAFVDPIFSQGATAAVYNGALADWAVTASLKKKSRRDFYGRVFERRVLQYYGFSRLLTFGDFGGEGVDPELVTAMMRAMPQNELELSLAASMTTKRSENLREMARQAGLLGDFSDEAGKATLLSASELKLK